MADLILIAEDDELLRAAIVAHLRAAGFHTVDVADGAEALETSRTTDFDLFVLDWRMEGLDGLATLKALRARGVETPVMFLTAAGGLNERVRGLDAGADDYLAKPFEPAELAARARALLRRRSSLVGDIVEAHGVRLDRSAQRAYVNGVEVILTAQDFELLETFVRYPEKTFAREALLLRMSATEGASLAAVEHAISRLRRKIAAAAGREIIETVRGVGYRLCKGRS